MTELFEHSDKLNKISHLQAAIRQLVADGKIKDGTKYKLVSEVL